MKIISRDSDYAVRALQCMARLSAETGQSVITVEEIAKKERLPRVFLRGLLQKLAQKKILNSHKGKGGGFSFRRRPESISIDEIISLFQGPFDLTNCVLSKAPCPRRGHCKLRVKLKEMNHMIRGELRKITIAQLD